MKFEKKLWSDLNFNDWADKKTSYYYFTTPHLLDWFIFKGKFHVLLLSYNLILTCFFCLLYVFLFICDDYVEF